MIVTEMICDSLLTVTEWFFFGFMRSIGTLIDDNDVSAVYYVSKPRHLR